MSGGESAAVAGDQRDRRAGAGIARGACRYAPITGDDQKAVAGKKLRLNLKVLIGVRRPLAFDSRLEFENANRIDRGRVALFDLVPTGFTLAADIGEYEVPARSPSSIFEGTGDGAQPVFSDRQRSLCPLTDQADRRAVSTDERRRELDRGRKPLAPGTGETDRADTLRAPRPRDAARTGRNGRRTGHPRS